MNVLQLTGSFNQGGSERQAVQLTRLLHESGRVNVSIAALDAGGVMRGEIDTLGLGEIAEFPLKSFYDANFFRQLGRFSSLLREREIDVLQTHDFYTNVFGMAAAALARTKLTFASKRETAGMRSSAQKFVENRAFGRARKIVVNSNAVRDYLVGEGVSEAKINVIYNGLDLERLRPKIEDRGEICRRLGLREDENSRFVTLVANLRHEVKNQRMFIRAAKIVAEVVPEAHFVLAGEGELRHSLEDLARELGVGDRVHFTGRCEIVPELLSISFAGVLTSFNEGFSNSILEYMAASLPVVATNVGGAAEAIREGETGFLVASDDDEGFARRLIALFENRTMASQFGHRGREIVEAEFSCAAQVERTLALYGAES